MKVVLGALTAVMFLVGVAAVQPAEARCWWNGYEWHCWHPHAWWWRHHHHHYYYQRYYGWNGY